MAVGELDTVAKLLNAFYRLTGTTSDDDGLSEAGDEQDDVAFQWLTHGCRTAQNWLIDFGLDHRWRKRSDALPAFGGTESTDGGRFVELSTVAPDFLRFWGRPNQPSSALVEPDGRRWGAEVDEEESWRRGDWYYLKNDQLWITRDASPRTTLHLEYYFEHPAINGDLETDGSIDFPMQARPLIVAEAANGAKEEGWLPGGIEMELKIERRLGNARRQALKVARRNRQGRKFTQATHYGTHW